MRFATRIFAAGLLAIGVSAGPAVAASASSGVTVTWVTLYGSHTQTYSCSGTQTYNGWDVAYVSNGCGGRVWLHAQTNGGGATYCVNPGAIAYGAIGNYEQILVSGTQAECDAGAEDQVQWSDGAITPYSCVDGFTANDYNPVAGGWAYILKLTNNCNVRVWLHDNPAGTGAIACVSPHAIYTSGSQPQGVQFQMTANQAPCSAG